MFSWGLIGKSFNLKSLKCYLPLDEICNFFIYPNNISCWCKKPLTIPIKLLGLCCKGKLWRLALLHSDLSLTFIFPDGQTLQTFTPSSSHQLRLSALFSPTVDDARVATPISSGSLPDALLAKSKSTRSISTRSPSGDEDRKAKSILRRAKVIHRSQAPRAQKKLSRERIMKLDWRVANW